MTMEKLARYFDLETLAKLLGVDEKTVYEKFELLRAEISKTRVDK